MHESVPAIAALGVSPIVRIPGMEPWMVKRKISYLFHNRIMLTKLTYNVQVRWIVVHMV